jgi:predicted HTH domain antitoxin
VIQSAQNGSHTHLAEYYYFGHPHVASEFTWRKHMNDQSTPPTSPSEEKIKSRRTSDEKSIRSLTLSEVDGALAVYDKIIRMNTELVKTKLSTGGAIPSDVLRDLSIANRQKGRLTIRRISLLIETGDIAVMELVDKLCKIKPAKATV